MYQDVHVFLQIWKCSLSEFLFFSVYSPCILHMHITNITEWKKLKFSLSFLKFYLSSIYHLSVLVKSLQRSRMWSMQILLFPVYTRRAHNSSQSVLEVSESWKWVTSQIKKQEAPELGRLMVNAKSEAEGISWKYTVLGYVWMTESCSLVSAHKSSSKQSSHSRTNLRGMNKFLASIF